MMSACRVITGFVALWAFVPQVGAEEPSPPATEQSAPVAVEQVAAPEPAVAAEPAEAATNADATATAATTAEVDDPVICKRFESTGTRLRKGKVCRKKSVWDLQEARAEEIMKGIERGSSAGVGGTELPAPGG